jgi:hypothetical protein
VLEVDLSLEPSLELLSELFEPLSLDLLLLDDADDDPADSFLSPETLRLLPDLKSVSYQPPPFSRNPAADTFFTNALCSHSGHVRNGSSLTF